MNPEPSTDRETLYVTGECFRNEKLPLYIGKATRAKKPFGTALLDLGERYERASQNEQKLMVAGVKGFIDGITIPTEAGEMSMDIKAREEGRFYLLLRFANNSDCLQLQQRLYDHLVINHFKGARLAAISFEPSAAVTPIHVLGELEKKLI
jgi:hypothetical protein